MKRVKQRMSREDSGVFRACTGGQVRKSWPCTFSVLPVVWKRAYSNDWPELPFRNRHLG